MPEERPKRSRIKRWRERQGVESAISNAKADRVLARLDRKDGDYAKATEKLERLEAYKRATRKKK